ncbi:hypothetical protein PGT21_025342 [Puccinia graminis f. sp. tritici]|uniref:Uncharacterized protein n=1 Tax=Puccinia graminis f. sp. tritici TaxID=56615 RepID=A0A5B0PYJ0_PUCGR|nr:hypothetical protein PGT21_025342 [Puccinia graminis f. sp. tritici]KAA1120956.1 hypothetical protein PGTUg99_022339 [Puccinia graminis f. sp. tritici]
MSAHHYATALAEALGRLSRICCHYLGDEYSSKQEPKVSPEKDLETRQVNLNKVEATLLPAIRDLVVELLKVLDLPPKESMFPKTKLNNAWEIVHRLSSVLYKLRSSVTPPNYFDHQIYRLTQQTYVDLKQFRCQHLQKKVTELIEDDLGHLFNHLSCFISAGDYYYSDHKPPEPSGRQPRLPPMRILSQFQVNIARILKNIRRSDFGILQSIWTESEDLLGTYIPQVLDSIHRLKIRHPFKTEPNSIGPIHRHLQRLKQTIILLRLGRIFFKKIGSTLLFTFSDEMSTAELQFFSGLSNSISFHLAWITSYVTNAADLQEIPHDHWRNERTSHLIKEINRSLEFISSHMIPSDPTHTVDDIMDQLFGTFKSAFFPHLDNIMADISRFQAGN